MVSGPSEIKISTRQIDSMRTMLCAGYQLGLHGVYECNSARNLRGLAVVPYLSEFFLRDKNGEVGQNGI